MSSTCVARHRARAFRADTFDLSLGSPPAWQSALLLADEGVPLCVIARAVQVRSEDLREHAQKQGRLIDMPENDWPPYNTRSRRTVAEDRGAQTVALRTVTGATRAEAIAHRLHEGTQPISERMGGTLSAMHGRLLQTDSICRGRYASPGAIDVHVFHLRQRLAPCDIAIISVHGHGYRTSGPRDRHGADCDWPRSAVISRVGALMRARTPSNFRLRGMFF